MATVIYSATTPGYSTASTTGVPGDIMFTFRGTIGKGVFDIQLSNNGTDWFDTGAKFDDSDITPKIISKGASNSYRIKASGSGFTPVVEVV